MKSLPELMAMTDAQLNALGAELADTVERIPIYQDLYGGPRPIIGYDDRYPNYCFSRDYSFSLRKDFTAQQHREWSEFLYAILVPKEVGESFVYDNEFAQKFDNATARQQTIAAVMVLQQGGV
jgi:hypothetical protein